MLDMGVLHNLVQEMPVVAALGAFLKYLEAGRVRCSR
jgi:hypothetical protein